MTVFYFGPNPNQQHLIQGNAILFWLLASVAVLLGVGLYRIATHPESRKLKFRHLKRFSNSQAFLMGGAIAGLILAVAYCMNWAKFYQMNVTNSEVQLCYFYPKRQVVIPRSELSRLRTVLDGQGRPSLVIETRTGRRYTAQAMYWSDHRRQVQYMQTMLGIEVPARDPRDAYLYDTLVRWYLKRKWK